MKLNTLGLRDKKIFSRFLSLRSHMLSAYAFENIYIWKKLFCIEWAIIKKSLCVFFRDKIGCFLYLPPLTLGQNPYVIQQAFKIMDSLNKNRHISRIENIESEDLNFFKGLGYFCQEKPFDYLCLREELISLKGVRFKSKRACLNYFTKHYQFKYLPFSKPESRGCLILYKSWMKERSQKSIDPIYRGMLIDSLSCLQLLLKDYRSLDIRGSIVKINKEIKGFTFGFKLNRDTFCILYEITDLSTKGLAQFIFRQFCLGLVGYKHINIMDDSGLANLKKVKLSYHPIKLIPAYIANRKDA
ncbi:MAG: phosphatidylglycerol lysyltransferase domain-containing protein [Candidatus Omnitrophota bacterium]